MSPEVPKIKVELCHDHFDKLVDGNVCATCPSKVENEAVVKAMATVLDADRDQFISAVVTELKSIRTALAQYQKSTQNLRDKIYGNGNPGIEKRLTTIEVKLDSKKETLSLVVAVVAAVGSIGAMLVALAI